MAFSLSELHYEKNNLEQQPWEHYLGLYGQADPEAIAARTGLTYDPQTASFPQVPFLGQTYRITWPDFDISRPGGGEDYAPLEQDMHGKILMLRLLLNGAVSKGTGGYKTYREMPWGEVYLRQFDGRCIKRLAFSYGSRIGDFRRILESMGGTALPMADAAYELEVIPGYLVRLLLWEGDEEFPPSSQFLFSDNFPLAFAAEDVAQLGDVIINTMKRRQ